MSANLPTKPQQGQRPAISKRNRTVFLEHLAAGHSVTSAATATGRYRRRYYELRQRDEEFAREWDEAFEAGTDRLEQLVYERAVNGTPKPIVARGEVVGVTTEFDVRRELAVLAARRPDRWRTGGRLEVTGADGGPLVVEGRPAIGWADLIEVARSTGQAHLLGLTAFAPAGELVEGEGVEVEPEDVGVPVRQVPDQVPQTAGATPLPPGETPPVNPISESHPNRSIQGEPHA